MKNGVSFLALALALVALGTSFLSEKAATSKQETAYERVVRTRTLRCAYALWPNYVDQDPNTGKLSGYSYDIAEAVADSLNLKLDWAVEIPGGAQVETLRSGKADAICDDGVIQMDMALYLAYSEPYAFFPIYAFVRPDDPRFTNDNSRVDAPDIKVSVIDGDVSAEILRTLYTKAKAVPLPQLADPSQMMMDVVTQKTDVVLTDDSTIEAYMQNNQGKLRKLSNQPIIVSPTALSTLREETALIDMLSQGIKNIRDRGIERRINEKYGFDKSHALYAMPDRFVTP